MPNATVLLKNIDKTNQEISRSGDDGAYQFAHVAAGTYNMEVKAPGFAVFQQPSLALAAGIARRLDIKLDIGQVSENVDVIGKGPHPAPVSVPRQVRIGGNVQATKLLYQASPVYPADAQAAGIEGTVLLQAVISTDGNLLGLSAINTSVDARLRQAAIDAVSQWKYQPTLLNDVPVEVITTITVNFKMGQ